MTIRAKTLICTAAGDRIRFGSVRYVAHAAGVVAWVEGQPVPLDGNEPEIEAELLRLADAHAVEAAERFGGPAEPWSGGDGQAGVRAALALLARREADDEVARIEAEIARLKGREPLAP